MDPSNFASGKDFEHPYRMGLGRDAGRDAGRDGAGSPLPGWTLNPSCPACGARGGTVRNCRDGAIVLLCHRCRRALHIRPALVGLEESAAFVVGCLAKLVDTWDAGKFDVSYDRATLRSLIAALVEQLNPKISCRVKRGEEG